MRRRLLGLLLPAALVLGGCAAPSDLSEDAAGALQAAVLDLHRAAAEERYDAAEVAATEVRAALDAAAEAGEVSVARYRQIDAALVAAEEELAVVAGRGGEERETDEVATDGERPTGVPAPTEESGPAGDEPAQAPATAPATDPASAVDEVTREDAPAPAQGNGGGAGSNGRDGAPGQQKVPPGQEKGPGKAP
ncbi:hypothetical protein J4G33_00730 [Actinotalea sp. BY-33]|uniref:Mucin-associated surface protein n=1 Tax=Actinotalea soli TaxID=2819234 RepID=A0A939RS65_9CELL|nr:hypothetical protein [Actinotalea soli]MBO1750322.1 hypothetical protein [Actinotalea soli]